MLCARNLHTGIRYQRTDGPTGGIAEMISSRKAGIINEFARLLLVHSSVTIVHTIPYCDKTWIPNPYTVTMTW